jgi:hypothetical protein
MYEVPTMLRSGSVWCDVHGDMIVIRHVSQNVIVFEWFDIPAFSRLEPNSFRSLFTPLTASYDVESVIASIRTHTPIVDAVERLANCRS